MRISQLIFCALFAVGLLCPALAEHPDRPIKMVFGYPPGGAPDILGRPLTQQMVQGLGQPIVIEYKPGASDTIAAEYLSRQPADGYTLHLKNTGPLTIFPHLRHLTYKPLNFTPIGIAPSVGLVLVVLSDSPAADLNTLIQLAKRDPASWSHGRSGVGGVGHLVGEKLTTAASLEITHIPYKGGGPVMNALLGGHVPFLIASLGSAANYIKSGLVRALAVSSAQRSSTLPGIPTIAESGFPSFGVTN